MNTNPRQCRRDRKILDLSIVCGQSGDLFFSVLLLIFVRVVGQSLPYYQSPLAKSKVWPNRRFIFDPEEVEACADPLLVGFIAGLLVLSDCTRGSFR